jgi:hypothetical protein
MNDDKAPNNKEQHDDAFLQEYFEICKSIYEQMERDGTWPWPSDSPNSEDMVDSGDHDDDL